MTRRRLARELRHASLIWCVATSIAGALGGIWGLITWPDDQED